MERKIITRRISEIKGDISRLSNALYAMDTTDIQRYPDNYELLSVDAALRGEKIACKLRHLLYASTNAPKGLYLLSASAAHGIQIRNEGGIIEITLPCLFPKRKRKLDSEFLLDPLYYALDKYIEERPVNKYRHCVVCFSHIYDRELPMRRIRDYDNIEIKQILDIVTAFLMVDDGGALCDAYSSTELGDTDCSKISVMEKSRFPDWLAARRSKVEPIPDSTD